MKCKDCTFWEQYRGSQKGQCAAINDPQSLATLVPLQKHDGAWRPVTSIDTAAALVTDPEFGCSAFQQKA